MKGKTSFNSKSLKSYAEKVGATEKIPYFMAGQPTPQPNPNLSQK